MLFNDGCPYTLFKLVNSIVGSGWAIPNIFGICSNGESLVTDFHRLEGLKNSGYQVRDLYTDELLFESIKTYDIIATSSNSNAIALSTHNLPVTEIIDLYTGDLINKVSDFLAPPMLLSSDGKTLISADWGYNFSEESSNIHLWESCTGKLIKTFEWEREYSGSGYYDESLFISPNEKILLAVSENEGIWIDSYRYFYSLWDLESNQLIVSRETVKNWVVDSIIFTSDNMYLASGMRNGRLKIWDLTTDKMLYSFVGSSPRITANEGKFLICTGFNDIFIYDLSTQQLIHSLQGHKNKITHIVLSPDEQTIISYSIDGTIRVWSLSE